MTAPEPARILRLEPVDFCCGQVLDRPQVWVLAEDAAGRRISRRPGGGPGSLCGRRMPD